MADGKYVWNGRTAGLEESLAADCALLIVERGRAVEPNQVRGSGRRRHFIPHRPRLGVRKRAPLYFAARNIEEAAVADGAHAPPGWRLILHSLSDDAIVRRHGDCDRHLRSWPIPQRH